MQVESEGDGPQLPVNVNFEPPVCVSVCVHDVAGEIVFALLYLYEALNSYFACSQYGSTVFASNKRTDMMCSKETMVWVYWGQGRPPIPTTEACPGPIKYIYPNHCFFSAYRVHLVIGGKYFSCMPEYHRVSRLYM